MEKSEFFQALDEVAKDFTALYINKKCTSGKIVDALLYYKANLDAIPKEWKFGSKSFWDFHYARGMAPKGEFDISGDE